MTLTIQEELLKEALVARVETLSSKLVASGKAEISNPAGLLINVGAKIICAIEDETKAQQVAIALTEAAAHTNMCFSAFQAGVKTQQDLQDELDKINAEHAGLLAEDAFNEPESTPTFLPAEEESDDTQEREL